jgi:hypothetical protein
MMILARLMVNHQAQRWQAAEAACRWLIILRSLQQTGSETLQRQSYGKTILGKIILACIVFIRWSFLNPLG